MSNKDPLSRRLNEQQKEYILQKFSSLTCAESEKKLKLREAFRRRFPAIHCTADSLYSLAFKLNTSRQRSEASTIFNFDNESKKILRQAYVKLGDYREADIMDKLRTIFKVHYPSCGLSSKRLWNLALEFAKEETEVILLEFFTIYV